jgi:alkanesulfonate monooxygenase
MSLLSATQCARSDLKWNFGEGSEGCMASSGLTLIGSCPSLRNGQSAQHYLDNVRRAALLAERAGWTSVLVYSNHTEIDAWIVAQTVLSMTTTLSPLVALQPLYMHPFAAARSVASLSLLFDRPVNINFVSGGLPRDLETFCDTLSHDERYERIVEYGSIMRHMLFEKTPLTFEGKFYKIDSLLLRPFPAPNADCRPMFTMSGSSDAGMAAARKLNARAIQYLRPYSEYRNRSMPTGLKLGARIGIISRPTSERAWQVANERFPQDPVGIQMRKYFLSVSDSEWVKELGRSATLPDGHPYWLGPYMNNKSSCPFLVGKDTDVAAELAGYISLGLTTFLVESPADHEDAEFITAAFGLAQAGTPTS